jgi:hypothetical protein
VKGFENSQVGSVFKTYPRGIRKKLMFLRQLIFDTASSTKGVGELEETLKWGEPAYLTTKSKSGSTIRVAWKKASKSQYAIYFNCQTNLVDTFKTLFPDKFKYQGNRSIVFNEDEVIPVEELSFCIAIALTYRRSRRLRR